MAVLMSATLVGCAENYHSVKTDGIYFHRYAYSLKFARQKPRVVVQGSWSLDNFHIDSSKGWVMNQGKRYYGNARMDRDGDGKYEDENVYIFDIKLKVPYQYTNASSEKLSGISVMIIGYFNRTEDFEKHQVAYRRFIGQLRFWKHKK